MYMYIEFFDFAYSNCHLGLTEYRDELGHELIHCPSQPTILDTRNRKVRQCRVKLIDDKLGSQTHR